MLRAVPVAMPMVAGPSIISYAQEHKETPEGLHTCNQGQRHGVCPERRPFFDEDDKGCKGVVTGPPNEFGGMVVQYDDDDLKMVREPIHGVLLAAKYVALPDEGDGMVEEEGA